MNLKQLMVLRDVRTLGGDWPDFGPLEDSTGSAVDLEVTAPESSGPCTPRSGIPANPSRSDAPGASRIDRVLEQDHSGPRKEMNSPITRRQHRRLCERRERGAWHFQRSTRAVPRAVDGRLNPSLRARLHWRPENASIHMPPSNILARARKPWSDISSATQK